MTATSLGRAEGGLGVVGPVGSVTLVVLAFVVMLAVMVTLAVVMAGRVVGAVLGNSGPSAADGDGQGDGECRGGSRDRLHLCLLADEFRSWLVSPGAA
jgi:hypothetical protein